MTMMSRGMTTKNFDPVRYSGRWFGVASLKGGFAGQGQEDCHCTQVKHAITMYNPFCLYHDMSIINIDLHQIAIGIIL